MIKKITETNWAQVREEAKQANPAFADIVDRLAPDKSFILYKAYYPYGAIIGDDRYFYYPNNTDDHLVTITDLPKNIANNLAYAGNSIPIGMVLHNSVELFIQRNISIPRSVYNAGTFFALPRELDDTNMSYHPSGLLTMSSGARSTFMLPNIGDAVKYTHIQNQFGIKSLPPKSYTSHWDVFRQIASSKVAKCDWSSCLLYFSKKWADHLANDPAWRELKIFLMKSGWKQGSFHRNEIYYNYIFSLIQQKRNLKPNPYLADTANHILSMVAGAYPGFIPATNNESVPVELLQQAFAECYGLQYLPTVIQPYMYSPQNKKCTMYYSLQYPSTIVFSPKSRKIASTIHELKELKHIVNILFDEITNKSSMCANTIVAKLAKCTKLEFYHNKPDPHKEIKLSTELAKDDYRFAEMLYKNASNLPFASPASFVRGCVKISIDQTQSE
ncbi:MAG: hypothetical protein JXR42_00760 [Gammaproteobacteria bacterium]|nr:hypothetical protein [Gammaproteobacteria bacterium]